MGNVSTGVGRASEGCDQRLVTKSSAAPALSSTLMADIADLGRLSWALLLIPSPLDLFAVTDIDSAAFTSYFLGTHKRTV